VFAINIEKERRKTNIYFIIQAVKKGWEK